MANRKNNLTKMSYLVSEVQDNMKFSLVFVFLVLIFLVQLPANGQSIAMGLGIVKPGDSRLWVTGSYRMNLRENILLEPELSYWKQSESTENCIEGPRCIKRDFMRRDIAVGIHSLFSIPKERFRISFGGGVGAHFLKDEFFRSVDPPIPLLPESNVSNSDIRLGLHFLAELDVKVWQHISVFVANRNELVKDFSDNIKLYGGVRIGVVK
jgi:hypothetical protein